MRSLLLLTVLAATILALACGGEEEPAAGPAGGGFPGVVASADGVDVDYQVLGSGSPAIVFVHCWSCDSSYWDQQVAAFSQNHQVVLLDLAGHGLSGRNRQEWTIRAFAEDVRSVVEATDLEQVILVGHSMGGPVALEAAALMPERVIGVIGVDTLTAAHPMADADEIDEFLAALQADFQATADGFVRSFFPEGTDLALVDRIALDMSSAPPEVALPSLSAALRYDTAAGFSAVTVPIHCINATPTDIESIRAYAPQFEVTMMEGLGHFPYLVAPEQFNQALRQAIERVVAARGS